MRKDKLLKKADLHDGAIAESKLITLKQLDFCRQLNKAEVAALLERRPITKCASYETRRKDIVTTHVSLNRPSGGDAGGSEQALKDAEFCYDDFSRYYAMFDQELQN